MIFFRNVLLPALAIGLFSGASFAQSPSPSPRPTERPGLTIIGPLGKEVDTNDANRDAAPQQAGQQAAQETRIVCECQCPQAGTAAAAEASPLEQAEQRFQEEQSGKAHAEAEIRDGPPSEEDRDSVVDMDQGSASSFSAVP